GNVTLVTMAITINGGGGPPPPRPAHAATATTAATPAWAILPETATAGADGFQMAVPADLSALDLPVTSIATTAASTAAASASVTATALSGAAPATARDGDHVWDADTWVDTFAAL